MELNLKDYVKDIPNFPEEGIIFRDITPIFQDADALYEVMNQIQDRISGVDFKKIVSPESRGFLFGPTLAYVMGKSFLPVRKAGKLPRETIQKTYDLEYGTATIEMHKDAIQKGEKVVIIDDLLATGGTVKAMIDLVEELGGEVVMVCCLIELLDLKGRENLQGYNVSSVITY